MSIAVRTVGRGRVAAGERVLVLGAGPIGQAVAIAALDRGRERAARRPHRQQARARQRVRAPTSPSLEPGDDLVARAREWGGGELPEVVVEATGAQEPMRAALDVVAQTGRVVVVGLSTHEVPLRIGALPFRELDVLGVSCCSADDFAEAVAARRAASRRGRAADLARVRAGGRAGRDRVRDRAPRRGDEGAGARRMSADPAAVHGRLFDVRGSRAVVTGAASGLGLAITEVLAECGARVTLADIDAERLDEVAGALAARGCDVRTAQCRRHGRCLGAGRLRRAPSRPTAASTSSSRTPGIAAVPGYANPGGQELHTVADDVWRRVVGVNLDGVLHTLRAAAGVMKPQGSGPHRGHGIDRRAARRSDGLLRLHREQGERSSTSRARPRSSSHRTAST